MITVTIADVLTRKTYDRELSEHRIYLIRDGALPLYVSKTEIGPTNHILSHLFSDEMGRVITNNLPESKIWQVDMFTVDDCRPYILKHKTEYLYYKIDQAEQAMICEYGPCLNVLFNQYTPNHKHLPDKYKKHKIAKHGVKLE